MNTQHRAGASGLGNILIVTGLLVALGSVAAMVFSGIGYRMELYHFRTGFTILRWAFWFALAGAILSLAGLVLARGKPGRTLIAAIVGIAVGGAGVYVPWTWKQTLDALPYIHDITTDTANPPEFIAAARLRKPTDHPVSYDGQEVADQQHKAYPDLATFATAAPVEKVFEAAKSAIAAMGLQLVEADAAQGRIEANQTSLLYGFTDDMVVRIVAGADGTKVDVRSKSRVGRSDFGQNAKRIRVFLQKLKANLG